MDVYGVKARLPYIFWVIASFLLSGCAGEGRVLLVYNPNTLLDFERAREPAALFGPEALATANRYGRDEIAGVNLNRRVVVESSAGYKDYGRLIHYQVYYVDRQAGHYSPHGFGHFGSNIHRHLRRTFVYSSRGAAAR
ncbi:MAG: hypothetical protein ACOC7R_01805 [Planctomycetota bacterium]